MTPFNALYEYSRSAVASSSALVDIGDEIIVCGDGKAGGIPDGDRNHISFQITNVGTGTLSDLALLWKPTADAAWEPLIGNVSGGGQAWALASVNIESLTRTPASLATAGVASGHIKFHQAYAIKWQAKTASSTATVSIVGKIWWK